MENKEFHKIIDMGNSNPNSMEAEIIKLKRLLDKCIAKVGRLQQEKKNLTNCIQLDYEWESVKNMIGDIAMALTGQQINFVPADNNLNNDYHENFRK